MAKKQPGIEPNEQIPAAMHFAMSNAAVLELANGIQNVRDAYYYVSDIVESETGCSLNEEMKSWLKECKSAKPDSWLATEWNEKKVRWVL